MRLPVFVGASVVVEVEYVVVWVLVVLVVKRVPEVKFQKKVGVLNYDII